jgi:aspartate aminotransferase, mitochondrial
MPTTSLVFLVVLAATHGATSAFSSSSSFISSLASSSSSSSLSSSSAASVWQDVVTGPTDPILGMAAAFRECTNVDKINLCVGAYRDEHGAPWILPSVLLAEHQILQREETGKENKEYLPIEGDVEFVKYALDFAYGQNNGLHLAAVQALSGTGACRIAGDFLSQFWRGNKCIYIPVPTWGNHWKIFQTANLDTKPYRYYDDDSRSLDINGMMEDLAQAPNESIILLHGCAHNPTGLDPTRDQWKAIARICAQKNHLVLFDSAYQGFASGDPEQDAWSLRYFCTQCPEIPLMLAQSFAKNFGLYGERCGTFSIVCASNEERLRLVSQLKSIVRPMYSSPPKHGALIVKQVLQDNTLQQQYLTECRHMALRMQDMRSRLVLELSTAGSKLDWSHLHRQIGMFAYTGHLTATMCDRLTNDHAIYLTRDGRISLAGLNENNLARVAAAIHQVTTTTTTRPTTATTVAADADVTPSLTT